MFRLNLANVRAALSGPILLSLMIWCRVGLTSVRATTLLKITSVELLLIILVIGFICYSYCRVIVMIYVYYYWWLSLALNLLLELRERLGTPCRLRL